MGHTATPTSFKDWCIEAYELSEEVESSRRAQQVRALQMRANREFRDVFQTLEESFILPVKFPNDKDPDKPTEQEWLLFAVSGLQIGYFAAPKQRNAQRERYFAVIDRCGACDTPSAVARVRSRAELGAIFAEGIPEWECPFCNADKQKARAEYIDLVVREAENRQTKADRKERT